MRTSPTLATEAAQPGEAAMSFLQMYWCAPREIPRTTRSKSLSGPRPVGPPGFEVGVFAGLGGFVDLLPEGFGGPAGDAVYAEEEWVIVGLVRGGGGGLDFKVDGVDGGVVGG